MKDHRVLLISQTPLFAEVVTNLLQREDIEVVASASNQTEAEPYLTELSTNSVVVEFDEPDTASSENILKLCTHGNIQSIIFLTRNNNRMTVHHCETIENATSEQLIQALSN